MGGPGPHRLDAGPGTVRGRGSGQDRVSGESLTAPTAPTLGAPPAAASGAAPAAVASAMAQTLLNESFAAKPRNSTPAADVAPADSRLRRRNAVARRVPPKMSVER
ncbi:hypothetical protein QFZ58_002893 [Streptomyces sp. B1I3]|nr:hypothetical protein [Streptomyces sp. B1I3]